METNKKGNNKAKKILAFTGIGILSLILIIVITFFAMFGKEVITLNSIEQVPDTDLFTMNYYGDYGFDEFLEVGASSDDELIKYVANRLLKGIPIELSIPDLGCSTFAAKTPEGEHVFGRNFDLFDAPAMMVKTNPKDGYSSISMVNLGFIGYSDEKLPSSMLESIITLAAPYAPIDGVNEAGVAIGVLLIKTDETKQETEKVDLTTTTAIRLILDYASNVDEAIELLSKYDMNSSAGSNYHFQISDKSGKSVVVEYIENEMHVLELDKATNFLLTPGEWFNFGKGQDRYEILEKTLEEKNSILTEEEAMDLLKAVSQNKYNEETGEGSNTQWSVIYNMTNGTADISVDLDYENIYSDTIK